MNYKIISTDFDGTLLTTKKIITNETKKTLLNYKNNNYFIVGITARNLTSLCSVCDINIFDSLLKSSSILASPSSLSNVESFVIDTSLFFSW